MNIQIAQFSLNKILGEGQFGQGYQAVDKNNGEKVFVKVSEDTNKEIKDSFEAEYEVGSLQLSHPNVLQILGAGQNVLMKNNIEYTSRYFIVSELAEGGDFFDYVINKGPLPTLEV